MKVQLRRTFGESRATRGYLGTIADVIAVVTFLAAGAGLVFGAPLPQAVLAIFLCVLCVALLVLVLRGEYRHGRRVRQSLALPTFADSIGAVSLATHALGSGGTTDTFIVSLKAALRTFADAYGTATGVTCRATVKIIYRPRAEPDRRDVAVATLCRSTDAPARRGPDEIDWINENTDFRQILNSGADCFFSNDLKAALAGGYRNSHFTDEVIASGKLPYLATMVWPVRAPMAPDHWDLVGFLCVDSSYTGTFDATIDVAPGAAFAHALYSGLLRYRDNPGRVGSGTLDGDGTATL